MKGFEPKAHARAIDAAFLADRVTDSRVTIEMAKFTQGRETSAAFIEPRSWA
jgi:hypothetical protein